MSKIKSTFCLSLVIKWLLVLFKMKKKSSFLSLLTLSGLPSVLFNLLLQNVWKELDVSSKFKRIKLVWQGFSFNAIVERRKKNCFQERNSFVPFQYDKKQLLQVCKISTLLYLALQNPYLIRNKSLNQCFKHFL
jgi:hypothetical protein